MLVELAVALKTNKQSNGFANRPREGQFQFISYLSMGDKINLIAAPRPGLTIERDWRDCNLKSLKTGHMVILDTTDVIRLAPTPK